MVEDFIVSDSLHLLHLGVMKKLLVAYRDGHCNYPKWSKANVQEISNALELIKLPMEIHRSVRRMDYVNHWKASEFGSFLSYIGIVVLNHATKLQFLNEEHYTNFARLFCATTICSTDYYRSYLPVAKILFREFITTFDTQLGSVTSNIHNLVHVVEEVEKKGALPSISTYPFENHLYQIKKQVRSGRYPLSQIINRMTERDKNYVITSSNVETFPLLKEPSKIHKSKFLSIKLNPHCTLRANFADKWFLTKKYEIVAMEFADSMGIHGQRMISLQSHLFEEPLTSDCIHVSVTKETLVFKKTKQYSISCILCKLVVVVIGNATAFLPLIHTLPSDNSE